MPHCSIVHGRDGDLVGPNGGINVHGTDFELGAIVEDLVTGELRPQVYFDAPSTDATLLRRAGGLARGRRLTAQTK